MKSYIVLTHNDVDQKFYKKALERSGATIEDDYSDLPQVYKIMATRDQIEEIRDNKLTKEIASAYEPCGVENTDDDRDETGQRIKYASIPSTVSISEFGKQNLSFPGDNWGLGRIDSRDIKKEKVYRYTKTGRGVDIYVIDSGINKNHNDLKDRVVDLYTAFDNYTDTGGHGTHVASTAAGTRFGVAKDARIYNVKIFDRNSTSPMSVIIDGANAALHHHHEKLKKGDTRPSVVNMSLGGPSSVISEVCHIMKSSGMVVVAAAGNRGSDLDTQVDAYPAESQGVVTVGSISQGDIPSKFSNYGHPVNIMAPGDRITAASHRRPNESATMSGTSMATPHVAGVFALALEGEAIMKTRKEVDAVTSIVLDNATQDTLQFKGFWSNKKDKLPNRILYTMMDVAPNGIKEKVNEEDIHYYMTRSLFWGILGITFAGIAYLVLT